MGAQGNKKESQQSCQDIELDWVGMQFGYMETGREEEVLEVQI